MISPSNLDANEILPALARGSHSIRLGNAKIENRAKLRADSTEVCISNPEPKNTIIMNILKNDENEEDKQQLVHTGCVA